MHRHQLTPRPDWRNDVQAAGLTFHTNEDGQSYWSEDGCYTICQDLSTRIQQAAESIHAMCMRDVIPRILKDKDMLQQIFMLTPSWQRFLQRSWKRDQCKTVYGRFDFAIRDACPHPFLANSDASGPVPPVPVLLEYNADTPTTLLEASRIQVDWFQDPHTKAELKGQVHDTITGPFSNLEEALAKRWREVYAEITAQEQRRKRSLHPRRVWDKVKRFKAMAKGRLEKFTQSTIDPPMQELCFSPSQNSFQPSLEQQQTGIANAQFHEALQASRQSRKPRIYFGCVKRHEEDFRTTEYMLLTCYYRAGLPVDFVYMSDLGWDDKRCCFIDANGCAVRIMFKLYPWEWMLLETFSEKLLKFPDCIQFIEPAWKLLLTSKAILPLLHQVHPGHANLVPAFFDVSDMLSHYGVTTVDNMPVPFVRKPMWGREGANQSIFGPFRDAFVDKAHRLAMPKAFPQIPFRTNISRSITSVDQKELQRTSMEDEKAVYVSADGGYSDCGYVYQSYVNYGWNLQTNSSFKDATSEILSKAPKSESSDWVYPVLGCWMVGGKAAAFGIREDVKPITNNFSAFVPHVVTVND